MNKGQIRCDLLTILYWRALETKITIMEDIFRAYHENSIMIQQTLEAKTKLFPILEFFETSFIVK